MKRGLDDVIIDWAERRVVNSATRNAKFGRNAYRLSSFEAVLPPERLDETLKKTGEALNAQGYGGRFIQYQNDYGYGPARPQVAIDTRNGIHTNRKPPRKPANGEWIELLGIFGADTLSSN